MSEEISSKRMPVSLARSTILLSCVLVGMFPIFALVGFQTFGQLGVMASAIAGFICWLGAVLALVSTAVLKSRSPVGGVFLGMLFRMGLPFLVGVALQTSVPVMAEIGILGFVLCYYLVALITETALAVRMIPRDTKAVKTS